MAANPKKTTSRRSILSAAILLGLVLVWELICQIFNVPGYVLPAPSAILRALISEFPELLYHSQVTLAETLIGLLLALLLGSAIAMGMNLWPLFRQVMHPLMVVTQSVPVIVLAPILMIWLGFGIAPKILTVVLMCFYPITMSFLSGLESVGKEHLDLLASFGASTWQVYRYGRIPAAITELFSGLRVAATYGISGALVGEWLSSQRGLGYYMLRANEAYALNRVFASVVMVVLWSVLLNSSIAFLRWLSLPGEGYLARKAHGRRQTRWQAAVIQPTSPRGK